MKKINYKLILKSLLVIMIFGTIFYFGCVFADETVAVTTGELKFCDYVGTRKTFKTVGYFLIVIKILVPVLLIGAAMIDLFKIVLSGKDDDLRKSVSTIIKRAIAGIIVFLIPSLFNYIFNDLVEYDDTSVKKCTTCLLDIDKCDTSGNDPDTIIKVKK